MKELAAFLFLALMAVCGAQEYVSPEGPRLAASLEGRLESSRACPLWIDVRNEGSSGGIALQSGLLASLAGKDADASGIVAELRSRDGRIHVLSGPQQAGSLARGANRSVEFSVWADEAAGPGVYPLDLLLSYRKLAEVRVAGDPELPELSFQYENASQAIPLEAKLILGPKVGVEVRGNAVPGREARMEVALANKGDGPALDLKVWPAPQRPFRWSGLPASMGRLPPGGSASAGFKIWTENETVEGDYVLPCRLSYSDGRERRKEVVAALVTVAKPSGIPALIPVAAALVLVAAVLVARGRLGRRRGFRRW
jgi:hypothetical protein